MRDRRPLLAAAALLAGACTAPAPRPNVVLVVIDTLRADHLGVYGYPRPISPRLDRLAAESVIFERCVAQSPWTKPSVASLFTSLYPQVHGVVNYDGNYPGESSPELQRRTGVLSERALTLAEVLRQQGYETAAFVSNIWLLAAYGFAQGFDLYEEEPAVRRQIDGRVLVAAAERWLEDRATDRPFFLYLHFMDVHAPYRNQSQEDFATLLDEETAEADRRLPEIPAARWPYLESRPSWADDELRSRLGYWRARYAAGVLALDRRLGGFFELLGRSGLLDTSYLVVTSDHGEELYEHGGWTHGRSLYEHQLQVPLIIRQPGGRGGGGRVERVVELVDLMPTLLAVTATPAPPALQGHDLSGLLEGHDARRPTLAFATATSTDPALYAVRRDSYKLIFNARTGAARLFDLARDPGEQEEIAALKWGVVRRLRAELRDHLAASLAAGALDAEAAELPADVGEVLRTLGYLD